VCVSLWIEKAVEVRYVHDKRGAPSSTVTQRVKPVTFLVLEQSQSSSFNVPSKRVYVMSNASSSSSGERISMGMNLIIKRVVTSVKCTSLKSFLLIHKYQIFSIFTT